MKRVSIVALLCLAISGSGYIPSVHAAESDCIKWVKNHISKPKVHSPETIAKWQAWGKDHPNWKPKRDVVKSTFHLLKCDDDKFDIESEHLDGFMIDLDQSDSITYTDAMIDSVTPEFNPPNSEISDNNSDTDNSESYPINYPYSGIPGGYPPSQTTPPPISPTSTPEISTVLLLLTGLLPLYLLKVR